MKMKKFIAIFIQAIFTFALYSQNLNLNYRSCDGCPQNAGSNPGISINLYDYSDNTAWTTGDIESDYDMRQAGLNSRWHQGIDLRNHGAGADMQRGDAIISPESGTVMHIQHTGYKYIIIDGDAYDFGYGHIFSSNNISHLNMWRSGNFVLKMDTGNAMGENRLPTVINLNTCTAYSSNTQPRMVVIPNNPHCPNDTLITTSHVALGDAIAPVGGSSNNAASEFPVHLHLYKLRDPVLGISLTNSMDPFTDLAHPVFDYEVRLTFNQDITPVSFNDWNVTTINYPGSAPNTISWRAVMADAQQGVDASRYSNVAQNLDILQLRIKAPTVGEYELIRGPWYRSEISLGARTATPIYPPHIVNTYGNLTTTGILPEAYRDNVGFRPYDNHYFADFITRIHKSDSMNGNASFTRIADLPQNARYNDGTYHIFAQVSDVRGDMYFSDTLSFTLDNFKPYVQQVAVSQQSAFGPPRGFHNLSWVEFENSDLNGIGKLNLKPLLTEPIHIGEYQLKIEAITSESMEELTLSIPALNEDSTSFNIEELENGTKWVFTTPIGNPVEITSDKSYILHFRGTDLNGNSLLNLEKMLQHGNHKPVALPLRQDEAEIWSPLALFTGIDTLHKLNHYDCGNGLQEEDDLVRSTTDCIGYDDVSVESVDYYEGSPGWAVVRVDTSIAIYDVIWTDEQGIIIGTDTLLENLTSGIYCYEVWDTSCCVVKGCVGISDCASIEVIANVYHPCFSMDNGRIELYIKGATNPLQADWGDGFKGLRRFSLSPGPYHVTITDDRSCSWEYEYHVSQFDEYAPCVDFLIQQPNCTTYNYGVIQLILEYPPSEYDILWYKNNVNFENPSHFFLPYAEPGKYTIIVSRQNSDEWWHTIEIVESNTLELTTDVIPTFPENANNGSILLSVNKANLPILVTWSGPSINSNNQHDLNLYNLEKGLYCVTVTDYKECSVDTCLVVPGYNNPLCEIIDEIFITKPCIGTSTGKLVASYQSKMDYTYEFEWSDGIQIISTSNICENLTNGLYYLSVTEINPLGHACIDVQSILLEDALPVSIVTVMDYTCPGLSNGGLSTNITSGEGPFAYLWSSGQTTSYIDSVAPGIYIVTISDMYGCDWTFIDSIDELIINRFMIYDKGCDYGDLFISRSSNYMFRLWFDSIYFTNFNKYNWFNGVKINPGLHTVKMETSRCIVIDTIYTDVYHLDIESEISYPCDETESGWLSTDINSDWWTFYIGSWEFQWSDGLYGGMSERDIQMDSLYCLYVKNDEVPHCKDTLCLLVDQEWYAIIDSMQSEVNMSCFDYNNGSIYPVIESNSGLLRYQWSTGDTTKNLTNLAPGTYCLTVTDYSESCQESMCFDLSSYEPFEFYLVRNKASEYCDSFSIHLSGWDGELEIAVYNHEPQNPISILWSTGASTSMISGLKPGEYTVTVSNSNGCTVVDTFMVECCWGSSTGSTGWFQVPYFIYAVDIQSLSHPDSLDGNLILYTITTPPDQEDRLTYVWRDMASGNIISNNPSLYNLPDGHYCLEISNGCYPQTECYYIKHCPSYTMDPDTSIVLPCSSSNPYFAQEGSFTTNPKNGYGEIDISWYKGCGTQMNTNKLSNQKTIPIAYGTFNIGHTLILKDMAGCKDTICVDRNHVNGISPHTNLVNCTSFLSCNGSPINSEYVSGNWLFTQPIVNENVCETIRYCEWGNPIDHGIPMTGTIEWATYVAPFDDCRAEAFCIIGGERISMGVQDVPENQCCYFDDVNAGIHVNFDGDPHNNIDFEKVFIDSLCLAKLYCSWDLLGPYYFVSVATNPDTCQSYLPNKCWVTFGCNYDSVRNAFPNVIIEDQFATYQIDHSNCGDIETKEPCDPGFTGSPSDLFLRSCGGIYSGISIIGPDSLSRWAYILLYDTDQNLYHRQLLWSDSVNSSIEIKAGHVEACDSLLTLYGSVHGDYSGIGLASDDLNVFMLRFNLNTYLIDSARVFGAPGDQRLYAMTDSLLVLTSDHSLDGTPIPSFRLAGIVDTGLTVHLEVENAQPIGIDRIGNTWLLNYRPLGSAVTQKLEKYDATFILLSATSYTYSGDLELERSLIIGDALYNLYQNASTGAYSFTKTETGTLNSNNIVDIQIGSGSYTVNDIFNINGLPGLLINYDSLFSVYPDISGQNNSVLMVFDTSFSSISYIRNIDLPNAAFGSVAVSDTSGLYIAGRTNSSSGLWDGIRVDTLSTAYSVFVTHESMAAPPVPSLRSSRPLITFRPNPMRSGSELYLVNPQSVHQNVSIYNLTGNLIDSRIVPAENIEIITFRHGPGIYFIQSSNEDGSFFVEKLIVVD